MSRTQPTFIEDLDENQAQPILVERQGNFIAIKQVDGAGPDEAVHWVLLDETLIKEFIADLRAAHANKGIAT